MSSFNWWRSWHGAATDHKWSVVAARSGVKPGVVAAVAWALLDYASQNDDRGSIAGFDPEEYAVYSGFAEADVIAIIQAMKDKGIITGERFTSWEKRQPKREDDSTERVTRWREMKRSVTHDNASDKERDTDKDSETDTEREGRAFPDADAGEWKAGPPPPPAPADPENFEGMSVRQAETIKEIQLVVKATGWMPGKPVWRMVVETIRGYKLSKATVRECYTAWCARGFKRENIAWLTEWAVNGIPAARGNEKRSGNTTSPDAILAALDQAARMAQ